MNIRKYTQRAESPVINSVGQRPTISNQPLKPSPERAKLTGDYAPLGLNGLGFVQMIGHCPIIMMMPLQGNKQTIRKNYRQSS